jgi:hypothetical protein
MPTALLFVLVLGVPGTAAATPISVGVVALDTFVVGPGGTNAFFVSNLTGDPSAGGFAQPPAFPVATSLVFESPLLQWFGPAGSPFDFGHVGIGQAAAVFCDYVGRLSPEDRAQAVSLVVGGALAQEPHLVAYPGRCLDLALNLCVRGYRQDILAYRDQFVREVNDEANRRRWTEAQDRSELTDGPGYRSDWHYALALCAVLRILAPQQTLEGCESLRAQARSRAFREALGRQEDIDWSQTR